VWEINEQNAVQYLRDRGQIRSDEPAQVQQLAGGVSNLVLLVTLPLRAERFVLKQARGQLRVAHEWRSSIERIWQEVEVLKLCGQLLPGAGAATSAPDQPAPMSVADLFTPSLPDLLWEDRDNYLYAMTAAPLKHRTWKQTLLAGRTRLGQPVAVACGRLLGQLHAASWRSAAVAQRLDNRAFFQELRLDPYYRQTSRAHPDLLPQLDGLIDSVWQHRLCLVHGDFSPKNLLIWPGHVMLIDFEVGHYGDPAFDLGFFLTHLVAKAIHAGIHCRQFLQLGAIFWKTYRAQLEPVAASGELADLERRMLLNLAGCLLARVDGKSPLDYLTLTEQQMARRLAREWLVAPPTELGTG
jgi:aminoglycoside phosphotransferase (APT) family kinase protein